MFPIKEADGLDMALGPKSVKEWMPKYEDIPDEFKRGHNKWCQLVSDAFFCGIKDIKFKPKEGVDEKKAWRHFRTILGSWEPKHEHKEAACAYLLSQWFDDITYTKSK
jgi:hypothetical protein